MASWIVITFAIGWIYEKRKTHSFMLSWGMLTLELAMISLVVVACSLNSNVTISDVIFAFILIISPSMILALIFAATEALIQAVVISILKKKQQA